jgi:hypothetical protein
MKFFFIRILKQILIIPVAKIYFFYTIISNQLIFFITNFFLILGPTFLFNRLRKKEIQRAQISIHWLKDTIKNILNFKPSTSLFLLTLNLIGLKPYILTIILYTYLALGAVILFTKIKI